VADRTKAEDGPDGEDSEEPKPRNSSPPGGRAALATNRGVNDLDRDGRGPDRASGGHPLVTRMPIVQSNARPDIVGRGAGWWLARLSPAGRTQNGLGLTRQRAVPRVTRVAEGVPPHTAHLDRKPPTSWLCFARGYGLDWIFSYKSLQYDASAVRIGVMRPLQVQHTSLAAP